MKNTRIYKGRDGWQAETMTETDANGMAWQISTYKTKGGVICYAIQGQDDGGMFSYDIFGAKRMNNLASQTGQCNEAKVRQVHAAGLIEFERIIKETAPEKPAYILGVGQIIFTECPQGGDERKRVIYEVVRPGHFKTVTLDGKSLFHDHRVKPYSEKFGIGTYYNEGETMTAEEVAQLVESATAYQQKEATVREERAKIAAEERAAKIEKGKLIVPAIPAGVVAVIVAERRVDKSDHQSDYHGYSTEEVVYLSWSDHKRDLFAEMRKAAGKFEHTKVYEVAPVKPEGAGDYWTPEDEHREKYSMGAGYYLGESKYSGWIVKKTNIDSRNLEELQIAASEGRFLCGEAEKEAEAVTVAPVEVSPGKIQIIDYSEKAIAVIGDTYPIREILKEKGGRFNKFLSCGAGWIFKKSDLETIKGALQATAQAA